MWNLIIHGRGMEKLSPIKIFDGPMEDRGETVDSQIG